MTTTIHRDADFFIITHGPTVSRVPARVVVAGREVEVEALPGSVTTLACLHAEFDGLDLYVDYEPVRDGAYLWELRADEDERVMGAEATPALAMRRVVRVLDALCAPLEGE